MENKVWRESLELLVEDLSFYFGCIFFVYYEYIIKLFFFFEFSYFNYGVRGWIR